MSQWEQWPLCLEIALESYTKKKCSLTAVRGYAGIRTTRHGEITWLQLQLTYFMSLSHSWALFNHRLSLSLATWWNPTCQLKEGNRTNFESPNTGASFCFMYIPNFKDNHITWFLFLCICEVERSVLGFTLEKLDVSKCPWEGSCELDGSGSVFIGPLWRFHLLP